MRRALTIALPTLVAVALAGCGGGSTPSATSSSTAAPASASVTPSPTAAADPFAGKSAREILAAAQDAVDGASSVHMKGSGADEGSKIKLDLHMQFGKTAYGSFELGGTGPMQIRRIGKTVFIKASARTWRANGVPAQGAALFGGQWLKSGAKGTLGKEFSPLTSRSMVNDMLKPDGKVTKVDGITVGGTPTVGLRYRNGGESGTLYVAATGPAYPLSAVTPGKKNGGTITFSQWDDAVTTTAPAGALDFDKLAG